MSFTTDVNAHTKKIISKKQEQSMNKFSVTTPDRSAVNLEKTFSLEGSGSILSQEKKEKTINKLSFAKEIDALKKNHKTRFIKNINSDENDKIVENKEIVSIPAINDEAMQMINALVHTQNHIVKELTDVFDKRLEKFDDIVMDLIRCKTENERLKQKVDNLTRDNYKYKKEMECFKSIIPGVYIKKELDKTRF